MINDTSDTAEVASTVEQSLRKGEVVGSIPTFGSDEPMSRLEQQKRKKYYQQFIIYIFLFILVLAFFATIGLKILINTSLFIAGLSQTKQTTEKEVGNDTILFPPEITDIPVATNSATIKISGRAQEKKAITIFVNDENQKELIATEDGFETEITLNEGENEVYVEIADEEKKLSKKSPIYKVFYKNKKPELLIGTPVDGERVIRDEVVINGQTDSDASVKINGSPAVTDSEGTFSHTVRLKEGENRIEVTAADDAGNTETKIITVIYER